MDYNKIYYRKVERLMMRRWKKEYNRRFVNCINVHTMLLANGFAPNGLARGCLKNKNGPFYNVDRVNQTGGKRKQQSRRLKKRKGLRKRTKTRSRRT